MGRNEKKVLILGIGNILWADDGFGVRAVEFLHAQYEFGENVRVMDGGTQGINLLPFVEEADLLVVFDAVDYGLPPGTLKTVEDAEVPRFMGAKKISLHQSGFQDVLALAELSGALPEHMLLVGVQPEELEDYGGSLRPVVRARIAEALSRALDWLAAHGVAYRRRVEPLAGEQVLNAPSLHLHAYEAGRPDERDAPRLGDPRVLGSGCRFDPKPESRSPDLCVPLDRPRRTV
jgi:hydrogenase maturation protease